MVMGSAIAIAIAIAIVCVVGFRSFFLKSGERSGTGKWLIGSNTAIACSYISGILHHLDSFIAVAVAILDICIGICIGIGICICILDIHGIGSKGWRPEGGLFRKCHIRQNDLRLHQAFREIFDMNASRSLGWC